MYQKDWKDHSYIAMNGVYENAVLKALEYHSNLSEIVLCTDNDAGGIDAAERLRDILRENGYENIKIPTCTWHLILSEMAILRYTLYEKQYYLGI